ncbi:MAG: hypothetical protein KDA84_11690 [Planctomycetaceae bacterium]|nr:hypothetical protein [Planctomycetaceae bacterium]
MQRTTRPAPRSGLSLIEVVISTLLVGLVIVGALKAVGAITRGQMLAGDQGMAENLADQLLAEILAMDYIESTETPVFGTEASESSTVRTNWDDVDDFHLWNASPPQHSYGVALPNTDGWQRDVIVEWVNPDDPSQTVVSDQGLKRITVTVLRNGEVLARAAALRSDQ